MAAARPTATGRFDIYIQGEGLKVALQYAGVEVSTWMTVAQDRERGLERY